MKNILILLLYICLLLDTVLIYVASTRSDRRKTASFSLLCCALIIYTLGYIAELMANTTDAVFPALIIENFGIPHIAPLFLLTCIGLFCPAVYRHRQLTFALLYGVSFFLIVVTNPSHHLYYSSIEMVNINGEYFVSLERGPLYILNQLGIFVLLIISYGIIAWRFVKGSSKIRRQMPLFIFGSLVAFSANILNFMELLPPGLDPTPFFLTAGLAIFSLSLTRVDWMDIVATARDNALEHMNDAFIVVDKDRDFLYGNHAARQLFPALRKFIGAEPISELEQWPKELQTLNGKQTIFFYMNDHENQEHHYQAYIQQIFDNASHLIGYSYLFRDNTEANELIEELENMATTDPLTGILNRRSLFERIQHELTQTARSNQTAMLLMFDLDHFKKINDTYSHQTGDIVLQKTVETIKKRLRQSDSFGRIGGEEFVIFSRISEPLAMQLFANRLRRCIEILTVETDHGLLHITASFGITEVHPGASLTAALAHADKGLYIAKGNGRNQVVFGPPTNKEPLFPG